MAYNEKERLSWDNLFSHPLFNGENLNLFEKMEEQIKSKYEGSQLRNTYGRKFNDDFDDDDMDVGDLDIDILNHYYKFIQEF